ncbi:MAG TPA: hypothetical protein VM261_19215 [Kofleriaceae bacterium]|nr:hypothetical protein [Kofleriaceae bacterium]
MDIEQLERLALGDDRAAALAGLVPGTEEHDYWQAVHMQHAGALAQVDAMLARWRSRHGDTTLRGRLDRRQLLLHAGVELAAVADRLRDETGAVLHHEPEVEAAAARHPTRFEDGGLDEAKLLDLALGRGRGLDEITPAGLVALVGRPLDAHRTRLLLERLDRTGLRGLVALVAVDLDEKSSKGFGSVAIHHRLTSAELHELARLRPALRQHEAWVEAVVTRLRPPAHVDWNLDLAARVAYLDELWAAVAALPPSFNSLKAHVLYHRLACDLRAGTFDRARLLAYLALPRRGSYVRSTWLEKLERGIVAALDHDFSRITGLATVATDEPLVRAYLAHFLRTEDAAAFAEHVEGWWLEQLRAETRLLAGDVDVDRWTTVLGAGAATALRDRVELDFAPTNPPLFGRDTPVALDVDLKNAGTLRVKVFRIDVAAHFHARGADVDTALDLDGLAAGWEELRTWSAPALHRVRTRFDLAACERPGTYVVELIAGGKASRALVRKGDLRYTTRPSAAGVALTVLDEAGQPRPEATLWMGGREYRASEHGDITLPFSTRGSHTPILLVDGDLAVVSSVQLPAEGYALDAEILLDRQAVLPGREATALVRVNLTVAGVPTTVTLLEEPYAEITVTDRAGVPATRRQPLTLADGAEHELAIAVPENAASLAVVVGGRARVVSEQRTVDLVDESTLQIGSMHAVLATEALYLERDADGFALALLGKSGEPRAGRAVSLQLRLRAVTYLWEVTLATDERGRIALGRLPGVTGIHATTTTGLAMDFAVTAPAPPVPSTMTAREGEDVLVPIAVDERGGPAPDVTVVELRGGAAAVEHGARAALEAGMLRVRDLPAGEHVVSVRGQEGVRVTVVPAAAPVAASGWATVPGALVELRAPATALGAVSVSPESLDVAVLGATPNTRVHLVATSLWSAPAWSGDLAAPVRASQVRRQPAAESHYVSGRDIGDEYRYVLDRQHAPRRAGLLLDKPSLLLNPWALRTTSTAVQTAATGGAWQPSPARPAPGAPPASRAAYARAEEAQARMDDAYASYDFLAASPIVLANLRPDAAGRVRVPRASLGDATLVRVVLVDPSAAAARVVPLPARGLAVRDLRLAASLPAERHWREDRRLQALAAGETLQVADRATTRVELVDTVDKLYRALCALSGDDDLAAWSFLPRWATLSREEKLAHYSKHACHELALFIYFKDRPLFEEALRPYLASKLHKTFVDHWLLDEDLSPYLVSWRFARLNALERALLARRMPAVRDAIARSLADAVDLMPPDPEGDDRLVAAFLAGGQLSGDAIDVVGAAPMSEVAEDEEVADHAPKAKRAMRPQAPPPPPAPAAMPMMAQAVAVAGPSGYGGGDFDATRLRADLAARESAAPLYRGADKTQEWAEHNWWHTRVAEAGAELVPVAKLWRDLAAHAGGAGPFLSPHVAGVATGFASCVGALAVIDLPFAAASHAIVAKGAGATVTAGSHALAAVAALDDIAGPPLQQVLVGQSYFRADDRWEWDGAEQREKYVTGELLVAVVYQCQVVVTNPTSRLQRLAVLLQIPAGAMAVGGGVATRTHRVELSPYATSSIEYAFYFPAAGVFAHYGAQITRGDELVAAAVARELTVVREPTTVDTTSWSHVSQRGTLDEVVAFLTTQNLGRIDLTRVAWRMKEKAAFERVVGALAARHVHDAELWAYALVHGDRARVAEWLAHQPEFLAAAGPELDAGLVPLEPVARGLYQHLEYAPLLNARAHRLGERRQVLNDGLAAQWRAFLERVATRKVPGTDDWLAAAHYLFTMDRPDDATRVLGRAGADASAGGAALQRAYLSAYAAAARGDLAAARAHATPHAGHAVERWRHRFAALVAMLDEVEGRAGAATAGPELGARDHRDRTMDRLAAQQPSLAIAVENGDVVLTHGVATRAQLRFYRMDVELLFSRQPFLSAATDRFSFIAPGAARDVELAPSGRTSVRIPDDMARANLVIDAVSGALRATVTHFANDLAVSVMAPYGQLQVRQTSTGVALASTYVKTYARMRGGAVQFFKDGYTDLRGRFDYATLSTSDLDNVERFALLVLHDSAGASVLESEPPTR